MIQRDNGNGKIIRPHKKEEDRFAEEIIKTIQRRQKLAAEAFLERWKARKQNQMGEAA